MGKGRDEARRTGSEVSVGSAGLDFADFFLLEAELAVDTGGVATHRATGHRVGVVRAGPMSEESESVEGIRKAAGMVSLHATMGRSGLASGRSLPPRSTAGAGVVREPRHVVGSALVRTEEELKMTLRVST